LLNKVILGAFPLRVDAIFLNGMMYAFSLSKPTRKPPEYLRGFPILDAYFLGCGRGVLVSLALSDLYSA
jgi:hypothetical protein